MDRGTPGGIYLCWNVQGNERISKNVRGRGKREDIEIKWINLRNRRKER